MKVAVITRHAITNYGSLLQAYATQHIIEKIGYSCEIIDYIRRDESYKEHEKTLLRRKANWYNNPLKRVIYMILRQPGSISSGKRFEKERKKLLHLTSLYSSSDDLKKNPPCADIYVTGSDQVWGPVENGEYDDSYCLAFTNAKKIAYAGSFGRADFNDELKLYYKEMLSKYEHITVRESSAIELLNTIGIKSKQVIDPTLLLEPSYWNKLTSPIKEKRYILVYQLHNDKKLGEYAKKIAKRKGLPLIRISVSSHQILRPGKFIYCPSVGQFLSYIKSAECMITDSFHGTAFALIFNTQFVEILPNNKTETRNVSLLQLTGLSDRIAKNYELSVSDKRINFSHANQILKNERANSILCLKKMLEDCYE